MSATKKNTKVSSLAKAAAGFITNNNIDTTALENSPGMKKKMAKLNKILATSKLPV